MAETTGRLSILIADDHPLIRAGIRTCFAVRPEWYICAEAKDGEAVVNLAREHNPDVVILDFSLPLRNGLEVTRLLSREFPRLGILIYTMHNQNELVMDLLEAGARGWVSKNDEDIALLTAIETVVEGRTYVSHTIGPYPFNSPPLVSDGSSRSVLTPRELEIVKLVSEGATNRHIAARLNVSIKTVDSHRMAAMRKLEVHTVAELVRCAIRRRLISP